MSSLKFHVVSHAGAPCAGGAARARQRLGFTLIELMITVAILGVLVAVAVGSWGKIGTRSNPRNAAVSLLGALGTARARAVERNTNVWVVLYPGIKPNGTAGGHGGYFTVEDPDLSFESAGYAAFDPANPATLAPAGAAQWRVLDRAFLDDYPKKNVAFGVAATPAPKYPVPFDTIAPSGCAFCSGNPSHGAVVFRGSGIAMFVDGAGVASTLSSLTGSTAASRTGVLGLQSTDGHDAYLFAISGPTGFVGLYGSR